MGVPQICALLERMSLVRKNNEHKGVITLFRVWQTVSRGQDWGPDGTSESTLLSMSTWRWLKRPQSLFCGSLWASLCILNPFSLNLYLRVSRACWTLDSLLIFKSIKKKSFCKSHRHDNSPTFDAHLNQASTPVLLLWHYLVALETHISEDSPQLWNFFWSCCAFWPAKGSLFSHLQTKWLTDF